MENPQKSIFTKPWVQSLSGIIIIILIVSGILLYKSISSSISIEDATISAPVISISPEVAGILNEVYVKEGDKVFVGQPLARVGSEILKAEVTGLIISVNNTPGQVFSPAAPVIKMIDPTESRVLATIKENAGLDKIAIGNPVTFTVDAFGSKKYTGFVEAISQTANDSSVVFNISDKRVIQEYSLKIKYDVSLNPLFKNGMSAKIKVFYK